MAEAGVFDQGATLEQLGGNAELLAQLAGMFVRRHAVWRNDIADAMRLRNSEGLRRAVHRLRSPASNFVAAKLAMSLERMESLCRAGELPENAELDAVFRAVEADLAEFVGVLETLVREPSGVDPRTGMSGG